MKLCAEEKKTFKIKDFRLLVVFVFVLVVVFFGSGCENKKK